MDSIRISARQLVEFTLHGEDIVPAGSLKAMREGTQGHKARQMQLPEGWKAEVSLSICIPAADDLAVQLTGRMDAFMDGSEPQLEEIKLWSEPDPPEAAVPAHLYQARVYAWMLFQDRSCPCVHLSVVYVTPEGNVRAVFRETLERTECEAHFQQLLRPYLNYLLALRDHRRERDRALQQMNYPFPSWRRGQREMAVQVYTCISQKKRLLSSMPTGTGKTMAALFPALKSLGSGLTGQVFYLTARSTQRQAPVEALGHLGPLPLYSMILISKEQQCPENLQCHPETCPRARGHFLRDSEALARMMASGDFSPGCIRSVCDEFHLCPFEFSLRLTEVADVVICDYNYVFDPAVHLQRIFDRKTDITLLIDEAHHLPERIRGMLSGTVPGPEIRTLRRNLGRACGRRHPLYHAMTLVLQELSVLPDEERNETVLEELPESLLASVSALSDRLLDSRSGIPPEDSMLLRDVLASLLGFLRSAGSDREDYAFFLRGRKSPVLTAMCLNPGKHFSRVTSRLSGTAAFSATMHPLEAMAAILSTDESDALFQAPSPFPPEHLLVIRRDINTRFHSREASVPALVREIETLRDAHPGKYLVFFPSFAYLNLAAARLSGVFQVQKSGMTEEERTAFLRPYQEGTGPVLSLCVLGGIFSEGIDLPGTQLDGVAIVGTGLPQVGLENDLLRSFLERTMGNGYYLACQVPGMQKIAQAAGRVIRTENDRGVILLLDDRFRNPVEQSLCPPHWKILGGNPAALLKAFWEQNLSVPVVT